MEIWAGKVAVITSSDAAIEISLVQELALAGIIVVGLARQKQWIDCLLVNEEWNIHAVECNISSIESVENAFKWINETFGKINILINYARIPSEAVFATNTVNLSELEMRTREACKLMESHDEPGYIININIFGATREAVSNHTKKLRRDLVNAGKTHIRVTIISRDASKAQSLAAQGVDPTEIDQRTELKPQDIVRLVKSLLSNPLNKIIKELIMAESVVTEEALED